MFPALNNNINKTENNYHKDVNISCYQNYIIKKYFPKRKWTCNMLSTIMYSAVYNVLIQ